MLGHLILPKVSETPENVLNSRKCLKLPGVEVPKTEEECGRRCRKNIAARAVSIIPKTGTSDQAKLESQLRLLNFAQN